MIVLDYSIANISIPYISGDLAVAVDQGTYVITSFAVGNAISLPATGWLTKQFGAVKLIVLSLLLFVLFSWTCGLAWNITALVVSRFLQGLCSGPLIPISQTLLIMSYPPEKKNRALASWSAIVIAAPILGPILGGWISYDYHWPWIFFINIPVGLLSAGLIWVFLKERETLLEKAKLDWVGLFFLAVAVCCLQIFLDKGEQFDWFRSIWMRGFAIASFIGFTLLIVWSQTHIKPLLELKLFQIKTFAISVLFIGVMYAIYFGSVVLVPLWLQTNMNYTSIWAGIAVAPIGIAPLLFSYLISHLMNRFGNLPLLFCCFLLFAFSCFYTAFFDTDVDVFTIGFSRFLLGCALVFFIAPLFALSVQDVPHEKLPSATGIFHFIRALSGGIGTSLFTTLWTRRTAYHHQTVGENLTPFAPETTQYLDQLSDLGLSENQGLAVLNENLNQQAAMLSINDCFYLMGWIFLSLILILPLARTAKTKPKEVYPIAGE